MTKKNTFYLFLPFFIGDGEKKYEALLEFKYLDGEPKLKINEIYLIDMDNNGRKFIIDYDLNFKTENVKEKIFSFIKNEIKEEMNKLFKFCDFILNQKENIEEIFQESIYIEEESVNMAHYFKIKNNEVPCKYILFYLEHHEGSIAYIETYLNETQVVRFPVINYVVDKEIGERREYSRKIKEKFLKHKQIRLKKMFNLI